MTDSGARQNPVSVKNGRTSPRRGRSAATGPLRETLAFLTAWISLTCIALLPPMGYEIYSMQERMDKEMQQERQQLKHLTGWFNFYETFFINAMSGDRYILIGPKGADGAVFCKKI